MSFGWSAGDIANAITLIVKLAQALDDAEGSACDYRKAVSFLRDLTHTLEPLVNFPAWDAYPTYGQSIAKHIKHIKEPVKTFLEAVIKYEPSLGLGAAGGRHRNVLRKVQWYLFMNKKVLKLRDSIDSHMSIIDSELKHLTLDVVYKIEHKLPDNVRAIVREALPPDLMTLLRDHLSTIDARMLNQIDAVQTRGHERVFSSLEGQYQKLFVNIDSLRQQLKVTNITQERIELCLRRGGAQKLVKDGSASAADEAPGIDQTTGQDGSCDIVLDSDRRTAGALQEIYYMVLVYLGHFLQNLFLVLSRLVQPSAALTFQYDARYNISFLDAIGRAPRILPFEFFRSFKMMQDFIECEFSNLPGAIWIKKGRYMVSRLSDHQALDVATWARLIVPGSKVEMSIVIRKQLGSGTAGTVAYCPENSCSGSWEMTGEETWATCPDCQKRVLVSVQGKKPTLGIDAKTPLPSKPQGRLAEGTALDARSRNRGRPLFSTPPFDELMFTSPESEGSNVGSNFDLDSQSSTYDDTPVDFQLDQLYDLKIFDQQNGIRSNPNQDAETESEPDNEDDISIFKRIVQQLVPKKKTPTTYEDADWRAYGRFGFGFDQFEFAVEVDFVDDGELPSSSKFSHLLQDPLVSSKECYLSTPDNAGGVMMDKIQVVNTWLLQALRSSSLHVQMLERTFNTYHGDINDYDRWQNEVLFFWFRDMTGSAYMEDFVIDSSGILTRPGEF